MVNKFLYQNNLRGFHPASRISLRNRALDFVRFRENAKKDTCLKWAHGTYSYFRWDRIEMLLKLLATVDIFLILKLG